MATSNSWTNSTSHMEGMWFYNQNLEPHFFQIETSHMYPSSNILIPHEENILAMKPFLKLVSQTQKQYNQMLYFSLTYITLF